MVTFRGNLINGNNVNERQAWPAGSNQSLIYLLDGVQPGAQATGIHLVGTVPRGQSIFWDLAGLNVRIRSRGNEQTIYSQQGSPLHAFRTNQRSFNVRL
jgi:hypothetical protein